MINRQRTKIADFTDKMKIAFVVVNANRHEGTSRAVLEVAERLAKKHEVDLWARTADEDAQKRLNWIRVRGLGRPEVADFGSFYWAMSRHLKRASYDIIHSAGPNTSLADVYTIQTVHPAKMDQMRAARQSIPANPARRLSWWLYDQLVLRCEVHTYVASGQRGRRVFLPVSNGTKAELARYYRNAQASDGIENVHVVPNGADLEVFHPRNKQLFREKIRQLHGLSPDDFVLLFSGGDWRRKGLDLAIRALSMVEDQRVKILVVGDDRNGAEIHQLVNDLKQTERICFAGFQRNVNAYYGAADLFVFPTAYEAFSLATIEAAASGLPILMPDVSGAAELVGSGETGTIIRRDAIHIVETVKSYLHNPDLLARSGHAARALAERDFGWDSITNKTLAVYEQLLADRGH